MLTPFVGSLLVVSLPVAVRPGAQKQAAGWGPAAGSWVQSCGGPVMPAGHCQGCDPIGPIRSRKRPLVLR